MGTRTSVTLFDDIDGTTEDVRTVTLSLDGQSVELDLSQRNYDKMSKLLAPYLSAGRKTSSGSASRGRRRSSPSAKSGDSGAIRSWAESKGYEVNTRGRIKREIVEAYEAAQG